MDNSLQTLNFRPIMKKVLLFLLLLLSGDVFGAVVSEPEARQKALDFMRARGKEVADIPVRLSARRAARRSAAACDYYVFNMGENQGFVVVSGNDRTSAILGYADEGSIVEGEMPEALQAWLDGYSAQMAWLEPRFDADEHGDADGAARVRRVARTAVAPLIQMRWDQDEPYNLYCPVKTDGTRTVTGCVATAMAQAMYYYQYPTSETEAIPGYSTRNGLFTLDPLPATTFDWANMQHTYASSTELTDANKAVAELMQYCGWALHMDYNTTSSAYNVSVAEALKQFFGYSSDVRLLMRSSYSYLEWVDVLYNELQAGRPIVYGGQSAGGGHSFICDGYEGDDYFHFNWGWGGSSDGYFRLSLLTPWEQGIGGSSTLDGFNYSQDVIVGIHPGDGSAPRFTLSLEALQFTADDASATKVIERASADDDFTGIPLYASLWRYTYGCEDWNYVVRLSDEAGTEKAELASGTLNNTVFNTDIIISSSDLIIGSSVPTGTYYIDVLSAPSGADYLQPCYGSEKFRIKAEVGETQLTLTAGKVIKGSGVLPTCSGITVNTDSPTQCYEVEVTATVTGGSLDYSKQLLLYFNNKKVMGRQADILAGETVDVPFVFTPSVSGTDIPLSIYAGGTKLRETTITVASSNASNNLELRVIPTVTNVADGKLYGNAVRVSVSVENASPTNTYVGRMGCVVKKYASVDATKYVSQSITNDLIVGKNASTNMDFEFDGLETGAYYMMSVAYLNKVPKDNKSDETENVWVHTGTPRYEMAEGFRMYDSGGNLTLLAKTDEINAGSALCLDLTGITDMSTVTVTPSTNDNCLYLLKSDATVPSTLASANVVKGGTAEQITLTDAFDFWSPIDFTAENISYSRTFDVPASKSGGWSTIILPFDVAEVKVGEKTVDWFHSATDEGKNFWLKTFTGEESGKVLFDFAQEMKANTPYIIAVPGSDWGEEWQMTGKTVTFSAANQSIKPTKVEQLSGDVYDFCGSTKSQTVKDVYMLNNAGKSFVKQTDDTPSGAFRGWFSGSTISSLSRQVLSIGSGSPTGINTTLTDSEVKSALYDLQGRKINVNVNVNVNKGLYIQNGKKILVK